MMPKEHIIFGAGLAIGLFISGMSFIPILLIVGISILVDVDHIFYYAFKFRRCNIYEMYIYFLEYIYVKKDKTQLPILLFHNFETLTILIMLSFIYPLFIYVAIGLLIHLILDWIAMTSTQYPYIIKMSIILTMIENKKRNSLRW